MITKMNRKPPSSRKKRPAEGSLIREKKKEHPKKTKDLLQGLTQNGGVGQAEE